jgi:hypothetical protein
MNLNRTRRRRYGFATMLVLLLAQLSLAAYACTLVPAAMPGHGAAGMHVDCPGHRPAPLAGALCELHCQVEASVPTSPSQDLVAPSPPPLPAAAFPASAFDFAARTERPVRVAMATDPPVAIRYCRLLI